jgi:phosphoribosylamine-glycine ligase
MKKILLTSVSGPLGTGIINGIRAMDESWHIIGLDSNPVHFLMSDVDERHLVPRIDHERFYDVVRQIIAETQPDFFWPIHDNEMPTFAGMTDLDVPTFLPTPEAFEITQGKMAAYEHFKRHEVPVPETMFVNSRDDLKMAMERFNGDVWLRAHRGAGGKGALKVSNLETAIS